MEDKDKILDEIFSNDPFGLLDVKPRTSSTKTADERLNASFEEINEFVAKNEREPAPNPSNITEYQLYSRLKNLREDEEKMTVLEPLDKYGLLKVEKKEINSIDDIFNDDMLGIFDDGEAQSLFEFKHTPREIARAEADFVARRKPCKDFENYEAAFKSVHDELRTGKRKIVKFHQDLLKPGNYYVHNGLLLFLKDVKWQRQVQQFNSGIHNRPDGRTIVIFENGTMSDMMFQSLYKALHFNGKAVTKPDDEGEKDLLRNFGNVEREDESRGFIYVLTSLSTNPQISQIRNLHKIGYSTTSVEDRVRNAERDPTYLMAQVNIVAKYEVYNLNVQKFEQLLHNFFGSSCLDVDIYDENSRRVIPREWFVVPFHVIDKAIELIFSGEVINYRYDRESESIIKK